MALIIGLVGLGREPSAATGELVVADYGGVTTENSRRAFYDPFAKTTGVKVVEATTTGFAKLKAMVLARNVEWDVVASEEQNMYIGEAEGLLEPIDYTVVQAQGLIPGAAHKHGLIKSYYAGVLAYSTRKYTDATRPKSWADFWDVSRFPGPRGMRNAPQENVEFALMADGVSPDRLYPLDLDRAFRKLDQIKPHIKVWWTSGAQSVQIIADGVVDMSTTWNGRVEGARQAGVPVELVWNQALLIGAPYIVPKGARNRENAMRFIQFTLGPDRQAEFARGFFSGPATKAAIELIDPAVARRLPTHPDNLKQMATFGGEWYARHNQSLVQRWERWISQ
jgi:putative spermidine/putrescine transport system substrate-binding protein